VIDYIPVRYQLEITPTVDQAFFPTLYNTSHKEMGNLSIALNSQQLDFEIYLLRMQEIKTKNIN
jgi:hypothetical protein